MICQVAFEGYELKVFSTMYMDYGLEISKGGESLFYSPHCLCCESYGYHHNEWCEDMQGEEESRPWTKEEWKECILGEAGILIEAYTEGG